VPNTQEEDKKGDKPVELEEDEFERDEEENADADDVDEDAQKMSLKVNINVTNISSKPKEETRNVKELVRDSYILDQLSSLIGATSEKDPQWQKEVQGYKLNMY